MKLAERTNNVITNGVTDSVSFGIKQDGLAHIFSVLRNQLYSNKILAVLREYATNQKDAHTEAGCPNRPIEITLPSRFELMVKFRDYGRGMTEQEVFEVYAFYGESSKRNSNKLIGQLGLGSKAGFAYGDNFVITSFVDGVKNTYNAYIDPSQIGKIAKLASEPTAEENGVEISLPVKEHDVQNFHNEAFKLFRYFDVKPIIHGAKFEYEKNTPIISGKDWAIFGNGTNSVAIMGCIGYQIEEGFFADENIKSAIQSGLEVNFEIGELAISASREKLQWDDSTKKVVQNKLNTIIKEVSAELNAKFSSCVTLFDAHKLYGTIMDYGSNLYALRGMIKSSLQFNGKKINDSSLRFNNGTNGAYTMRQYETTYRGNQIKASECSNIKCAAETVLIFNDLHLTGGINNRVYNLVHGSKKVYVLSYRDEQERLNFLVNSGLVDANFIMLSSLPKISLASATGAAPKNSKHSSKEFIYDFNFATKIASFKRKNSDYWTQEVVDAANDAGVYVMLDGFKYQAKDGTWNVPAELNNIIKAFTTFGITLPKIYGFKEKTRAVVEANSNMVSLWKHIEIELTNYFVNNKIAQKLANRLEFDRHEQQTWLYSAPKLVKEIDAKTVFAKNFETFNYMKHEKDKAILDEAVKWKAYYSTTEKPEHDLSALAQEVQNTYPLFTHIRYWDTGKSFITAIAQYVNLIDG